MVWQGHVPQTIHLRSLLQQLAQRDEFLVNRDQIKVRKQPPGNSLRTALCWGHDLLLVIASVEPEELEATAAQLLPSLRFQFQCFWNIMENQENTTTWNAMKPCLGTLVPQPNIHLLGDDDCGPARLPLQGRLPANKGIHHKIRWDIGDGENNKIN